MNILDPRFNYVPSYRTDIRETWKRHGFAVSPAAKQPEPKPEPARAALPVREEGTLRLR